VRLSQVFRWPLAVLAVTVTSGVLIGHERYGASLVAQPFRLVAYAGIALALGTTTATSAWQAITRIFYAGAVVEACFAVYYLATGTSQTTTEVLSTGGVRYLALSTSIYLTGSLVCALLNVELDRRPGRQLLHVVIAGLALFGIIVSFGRTTYAAVVLIVPLLLLSRRYLRRSLLLLLPVAIPAMVIALILIPTVAPTVVPTLENRLAGTSGRDENVIWRERAFDVAMEGVSDEWLTGVGFGRTGEFRLENEVVKIEGDPHNSYIWLLAGGGALALGSFLVLCAVYLGDAVRRLRRAGPTGQALIMFSLATWLAFMVNALTGPILTDPLMLMTIWILFALPSLVATRSGRDA
jgi:O-antigen ligase